MAVSGLYVDETLLHARRVRKFAADDSGMGYELRLECGHYVWIPQLPGDYLHCGTCLEQVIAQCRAIQSHQEPIAEPKVLEKWRIRY